MLLAFFPPQQVAFLFCLFLGLFKRKMRFRIGMFWKIEVKEPTPFLQCQGIHFEF